MHFYNRKYNKYSHIILITVSGVARVGGGVNTPLPISFLYYNLLYSINSSTYLLV